MEVFVVVGFVALAFVLYKLNKKNRANNGNGGGTFTPPNDNGVNQEK